VCVCDEERERERNVSSDKRPFEKESEKCCLLRWNVTK
jgi:hypothetical protein